MLLGWSRRSRTVVVGAGAVVLVGAGLLAWRWQRDHSIVGQDIAVELVVPSCFNAWFWEAPNGRRFWAGHDPVVTGEWESGPRRLTDAPLRGGQPWDPGVVRSTSGTMHVDDLDRATFTSATGGTVVFGPTSPSGSYTADCQAVPTAGGPVQTNGYAVAFSGVLARVDPTSDEESLLVPGTVRAYNDGNLVAEAPAVGGFFVIYVNALGTITLTGDVGAGECASSTTTIFSGVPDPVRLVCG